MDIDMEKTKVKNLRHDLIINLESIVEVANRTLTCLKEQDESENYSSSAITYGSIYGQIMPAVTAALKNETEYNVRLQNLVVMEHGKV